MNTMEILEGADTAMSSDVPTKQLCPYFTSPFPDCYCVEMTSLKIPFVLKYCNGDQFACEIYQHNSEENKD